MGRAPGAIVPGEPRVDPCPPHMSFGADPRGLDGRLGCHPLGVNQQQLISQVRSHRLQVGGPWVNSLTGTNRAPGLAAIVRGRHPCVIPFTDPRNFNPRSPRNFRRVHDQQIPGQTRNVFHGVRPDPTPPTRVRSTLGTPVPFLPPRPHLGEPPEPTPLAPPRDLQGYPGVDKSRIHDGDFRRGVRGYGQKIVNPRLQVGSPHSPKSRFSLRRVGLLTDR